MSPKIYSLTEARTELTPVVRDAEAGQASVIACHSVQVAVVVSKKQWQTRP